MVSLKLVHRWAFDCINDFLRLNFCVCIILIFFFRLVSGLCFNVLPNCLTVGRQSRTRKCECALWSWNSNRWQLVTRHDNASRHLGNAISLGNHYCFLSTHSHYFQMRDRKHLIILGFSWFFFFHFLFWSESLLGHILTAEQVPRLNFVGLGEWRDHECKIRWPTRL